MLEMLQRLAARLQQVWGTMTLNQKVVSTGVLIALVASFAYLTTFRTSFTPYTVLFTELDPQSASSITTRLDQQNVPYRLSPDGRTIEVPEDRATRLKIELTAEGLPETGIVGFEILDTTNFGMSERIQEVQIQRALQGHLERALMTLDPVSTAKVTLSIPEPTLFTEEEEPASAAVILGLRRTGSLPRQQVEGLTYFIASAIPGLDPGHVTILDTRGNTLTDTYRDETAMLSSTQWEVKTQMDHQLAEKARQLLDGAFGMGKSLVTVNTELDWDRLERQSTSYDQENSAMRSEERFTATEPTPDGVGEQEESVVNYETGQVIENYAKNIGDIERLTVSVFIDHRDSTWTDTDGQMQMVKVPWSDEQIASIRAITVNAVGFDELRGDRIEVTQTPFTSVAMADSDDGLTVQAAVVESLRILVTGLAILAAIGVFYVILRALTNSLDPSKISVKADEEIKKHRATFAEEEQLPESDRDVLVRKIIKTSADNPEIAAKTIKSFFRED